MVADDDVLYGQSCPWLDTHSWQPLRIEDLNAVDVAAAVAALVLHAEVVVVAVTVVVAVRLAEVAVAFEVVVVAAVVDVVAEYVVLNLNWSFDA